MKYILTLICACLAHSAFSQSQTQYNNAGRHSSDSATSVPDSARVFTYVQEMPSPGYDVNEFLAKTIVYPPRALRRNIQGRVIVRFTVNKAGKITDVHVIKGVSPELDEEALRVVSMFPPWQNPGKQNGKPVPVFYSLPIQFRVAN